jgi:hypothetical protein
MYNFLTKNGTLLAFLVGAVISILFVVLAISGINADDLGGTDLSTLKDKIPTMNYFNFGLQATIGLILVCVLLFLLFFVVDIIKFPKAMIKSLIALAAVVVLFFVIKSAVKAETGPIWNRLASEFAFSESQSKGISAGIWVTAALLIGTVATMIISEIRNFFK